MKFKILIAALLLSFSAQAELWTITFVEPTTIPTSNIDGNDVYLDGVLLDSVDMVPPLAIANTTLPQGMTSFVINVPFGTHIVNIRTVHVNGIDSTNSPDLIIVSGQNGLIQPDPPNTLNASQN